MSRELVIGERFEQVILVRLGKNRVVNEFLATQIAKEIEAVSHLENAALVFEIDSGGGDVDAATEITDLIRSYQDSDRLRIFAYVPNHAYSAAAWIAFACRGLIIAPEATIGDIQPLIRGFQGYERAPEKIVTVIAEQFRLSCRSNGLQVRYPSLFLEAMVDKDIEIVEVENRKLGTTNYMRADTWNAMPEAQKDGLSANFIVGLPGKALTTNGRRLLDFGFAVKLMEGNHEKLIDILGAPNVKLQIKEVEQPREFAFPEFDISMVLLILGIVLLVLELKTPGLGIFGIGGILAIIIFFLVRAEFSDAALWPTALFLVGVFLLVVEVAILPGLIAPGLVGLALILFATWSSVAHPGETGLPPFPDLANDADSQSVRIWASSLIGGLLGGFSFTFVLGKFLHRLPFLNNLIMLKPKNGAAQSPSSRPQINRLASVGETGSAITDLRPSGAASIGGKRVNVVTKGKFVEAGSPIRVLSTSGNRIVVKEIKTGDDQ